ncbi:site-specific integrase [Neobacillus pocheonensis]|uniref:Site-specific integrase n=1 Tax=Neobacillus pocheonensis TaxID=363869 RepID=A0ABT0WHR2_9BACI|nr:site-specific integrase [Neobacillus pocheonensis]
MSEHKIHFVYFKNFLKQAGYTVEFVHEVTEEMCICYWVFMRNKIKWADHKRIGSKLKKQQAGLSPATIILRTRTLKAQFNYYKKKGYIEENPWQEFNLENEEATPRYWNEQELTRLFESVDRSTFEGERNFALFTFLLDTGARISEALQLNEWDMDLESGEVYFSAQITKNKCPRTSPLAKDTISLLKSLFKKNASYRTSGSHAAFITASGTRLKYSGARYCLVSKEKKAKIKRPHLHQFRHSFAVHYTLSGGDESSLRDIGGWKTEKAIKRYRKIRTNELKVQHQKFSPVNKLFI